MGWEPWPRPTYVVNTRDEWSRFWNERYASQSCYHFDGPDCVRAAMPEIDFDRFTLIGIYRELDPSQSLSLDSVEYKDGHIQVFTTLKASPGISASVQGSLSLFFLIPKTDLAVTFTERDEA